MKLKLFILMALTATTLRAQTIDDAAQYAPFAAAIGLEYCGVDARHELRDRIAVAATSLVTLTATVAPLKLTIDEQRPDGSDHRSFPSGHAARAFAGAEMVRTEYGWPWGLAAYAWATGVGLMRVAGDHHYLHDIAVGAAIGFCSTRVAYWLLPLERRLLGWEHVTAAPVYDQALRGGALQVVVAL